MAKQVGPIFITGTIDGVIFYKLNGQYYLRAKGDYKSGKQMRKDPRLKRTMQNADRFGVASRIVKYAYYRQLPKAVRRQGLFSQLTGMVNRWLYQGKTREEAEGLLIAYCKGLVKGKDKPAPATEVNCTTSVNNTLVKKTAIQPNVAVSAVAPATKKPISLAPSKTIKQARYLSNWKVETNRRKQVSKLSINESARQYKYLYGSYEVCGAEKLSKAEVP